eukprot:8511732-Lingulodinium_polyedra.AAC.1
MGPAVVLSFTWLIVVGFRSNCAFSPALVKALVVAPHVADQLRSVGPGCCRWAPAQVDRPDHELIPDEKGNVAQHLEKVAAGPQEQREAVQA